MNSRKIKELYEKLNRKSYGCDYYKMDLHIHTPASKCYKSTSESRIDEYERILGECLKNNIKIIAITDHNSVLGYYELNDMIKKNYKKFSKYKDILILPGIEISCFGKHLLTIFPPDTKKERLNTFLDSIGIDIDEQGNELADAYKVTPLELMKMVHYNGGITILAHADAANGMLQGLLKGKNYDKDEWIHKGKSLAAIVRSEFLHGISLVDTNNESYLVKDILNNDVYRRENSTSIIYCSDSHGTKDVDGNYNAPGQPIGSRFTYIKLSELSFHGLYISLLDPDVRIFNRSPDAIYPYIEGIAINGGFLGTDNNEDGFQLFRFNKALNCVIGARGTGKSTLLDVIQYTLYPDKNESIAAKFDTAVVFLNFSGNIYAFSRNAKLEKSSYTYKLEDISQLPIVYKMNSNGNFINYNKDSEISYSLQNFSSVAFRQRDIFKYAEEFQGPADLINNLLKINHKEEYNLLLNSIEKNKGLISSGLELINKMEWQDMLTRDSVPFEDIESIVKPYSEIQERYREIYDLRMGLTDDINKILDGKVILSISKKFNRDEINYAINEISERSRRKFKLNYENTSWIKKILSYLIDKTEKENIRWLLPLYILQNKPEKISESYAFTYEDAKQLVDWVRPILSKDMFKIFMEDIVDYQYNVNYGIKPSHRYLQRNMLSMGQKSVAMLLVIVTAAHKLGDSRPLIIDQPEDDLDNIYIFSSLVKEFRNVKSTRQLIFATHNPNIPIAGDAENIIILKSTGDNGLMDTSGSIDKKGISKKVLDILEGGKDALNLRVIKYSPME